MYVKVTNGSVDQYPYTVGELRRDNPNTSFPRVIQAQTLESYGVYAVTTEDYPVVNPKTHKVVAQTTPTLVDDIWTIGYNTVALTAEEITSYNTAIADSNRAVRDRLLTETDWWAVSDRTMTAEQTAYRQALRDITSHANWPHLDEADWPTKP